MNKIENLDFAVLDADVEFSAALVGEITDFGQVLQPGEICPGPAAILDRLNQGAVYVDPLMGIMVSRTNVLEQLSQSLATGATRMVLAGNARMVTVPRCPNVQLINYPRFWYVDRLGGWPIMTGVGQPVAIIDSGLSETHLCHRREVPDDDFTSLIGIGEPMSDYGDHGTNCAGVIGARSNCGERIAVAPDCRLIVGQVLPGTTSESLFSVEWALLTSWALHCRGAKIFSISLGIESAGLGKYMSVDVYSSVAQRLRRHNAALIFCAAGGQGSMRYPAAAPGVIAVGGYLPVGANTCKVVADVSSGGIVDLVKSELLLGPSIDLTTTKNPVPPQSFCGIRDDFSGLSAACAFVAGVAALYLERYPKLSLDEIVARMLSDAEKVPDPTGTRFFNGVRFPSEPTDRPC